MRIRPSQRAPQQFAQLRQHGVGARDVLIHHRRNRIQRIKKKVRLQLQLQILELRLRQSRLQLRRHDLPVAQLAIVIQQIERAHKDGIDHHEVRKFHRVSPAHDAVVIASHPHERKNYSARNRHQRRVHDRKNNRGAQVKRNNAHPPLLSEAKLLAHPHHRGNEHDRRHYSGCFFQGAPGKCPAAIPRQIVKIEVPEFQQAKHKKTAAEFSEMRRMLGGRSVEVCTRVG